MLLKPSKMKRFILFLSASVILGFSQCTRDTLSVDEQEKYFPLQVGLFWTYTIDEIRYSPVHPPESLSYQLKYEIIESFINGEGVEAFVIYVSTRQTSSLPWIYQKTLSAYMKPQYAVVTEPNGSFIKLQYPLRAKSTWDGNKLNVLDTDQYTIEGVDVDFVTGDSNFSKCVVVNQSDEQSLLFKDIRKEVYSWNVGLVFKESTVVEFNTSNGLPGTEIVGGFYWKQVLLDHGGS